MAREDYSQSSIVRRNGGPQWRTRVLLSVKPKYSKNMFMSVGTWTYWGNILHRSPGAGTRLNKSESKVGLRNGGGEQEIGLREIEIKYKNINGERVEERERENRRETERVEEDKEREREREGEREADRKGEKEG